MKLRTKIFLSILIVSLTTLSACSYYLINRNHLNNIAREQERSLNEYEFLQASISNGIDFSTSDESTIKLLISRYAQYYAGRGIILILFKDGSPIYSDFSAISQESYNSLLSVQKGKLKERVIHENNDHYFFISGEVTDAENYVLVYARDITSIYLARTQSTYLTLLLSVVLIIILSFLSYLYSRWITKPIEQLHSGADAVSQGNYSARISVSKDEFKDLGNAFNEMAGAVELRTKELKDKAKEIEKKANELQEFIDDLSHEMNTPLTSIQGYSEFLLSARATEEQKQKAAATIKQETLRMKDIYTKLMLLSIAREQKPDISSINMQDLFQELSDSFYPQLKEKNIYLYIECSYDTLCADRALIHMALSNMIKNSIQALTVGGIITLKTYIESKEPVLEVSDNGCGIPKDKINEVTKPFFRVDKSRSRATGGAGLGLSICKRIAELHQADLIIQSEEGKGTSIKLIFPEQEVLTT